jgi:transposase
MRRIKDCLRLHFVLNQNQTQIANTLSISRSTVQDYLQRIAVAKLKWEDIEHITDEELGIKLFHNKRCVKPSRDIDFTNIHKELRRTGVTLQLLWEEYRDGNSEGYSYSQYCEHYRRWRQRLNIYLRQQHKGGDVVFVDYSGKKPSIVDINTGQITEMELFVMVWGASNFLYAEAHESQKKVHWSMAHCRAFEYAGCAPHREILDNVKSGVDRACKYDPDLNQTFQQLCTHYGFVPIPARPYKPKDKPLAENGVLIVQRWILARLRNRIFHTLEALNSAIRELLDSANNRQMKKLKCSRRELFEKIERPNARALPESPYKYHEWQRASIAPDHHIEALKHYYSVPAVFYRNREVDVRISESSVEIFDSDNKRLAIHVRSFEEYRFSTNPEHMPDRQKSLVCLGPAKRIEQARRIGVNTEKLIQAIMISKPFPEQGIRPTDGIFRLAREYGSENMEKASALAIEHKMFRVREIKDILKNRLYERVNAEAEIITVKNSENIRGKEYFNEKVAS